jgi:hypothetical protein
LVDGGTGASAACAVLESPPASAAAAKVEVVRTKSRRVMESESAGDFMVRFEFLRPEQSRQAYRNRENVAQDCSRRIDVSVKAIGCNSPLIVSDYEHFVRHF